MPANADTFRKTYRSLSPEEQQAVYDIKMAADQVLELIERMPANREQSLAKTHLENAVMWAVKGITG